MSSEGRPPSRRERSRPPGSAKPHDDSEFLALGYHAVIAALEHNPQRIERVLLAREQRDGRTRRIVELARRTKIPFSHVPKRALDRLAQGLIHQGVVAKLAGADLLSAKELLARLPEEAVVLVLDGVNDPRNLGAIIRSAAAFGADGLFLPGHRSAGIGAGAARTAAGGLELVPIARAGNVNQLLDRLADRGLLPAALDTGEEGVPPWEAPLASGVALVAGGEEKGIRPSVLSRCPVRLRIPVRAAIGSLNVSVAVGIALAEIGRQKQAASRT